MGPFVGSDDRIVCVVVNRKGDEFTGYWPVLFNNNKTGSAAAFMPLYDVSYEIIFSTSDLLLA